MRNCGHEDEQTGQRCQNLAAVEVPVTFHAPGVGRVKAQTAFCFACNRRYQEALQEGSEHAQR